MTAEALKERLDREAFVCLTAAAGPMAVEEPMTRQRVVRRLADDAAVRRFVTDLLETYERVWDGCGCKVEYCR